ncbi:MAG: MOSC N-terminal beta barrel domain-containing protein [Acidobacteriota bacterium]
MFQEVGRIKAIFRYPVKSMAGEQLESSKLGWHGLEGDRRFALHRLGNESGFPWLTAGRLPQLLQYKPVNKGDSDGDLPTHVITPDGRELELRGEALQQELSAAFGSPVQMMRLDQGIFDEAKVSVISTATIQAIGQEAGSDLDVRRFRPNLLIETLDGKPFAEDAWVGKVIRFKDDASAAGLSVLMRDIRCAMINIDPMTGISDPKVLKAAVRLNDNDAGLYASVVKPGSLSVGDRLYVQKS